MTAAAADSLVPGDTVYACFGGHPQECIVLRVVKERSCRRIYVHYKRGDGHGCNDRITHRSVFGFAKGGAS